MANLTEIHGNIFTSPCNAIVNTVNCEGVMGRGMALECCLRFPAMVPPYEEACQSGTLRPGKLHYWKGPDHSIVNFPTKDRWRAPSRMRYLEQGLDAFAREYAAWKLHSVAFPLLGTSNGGLLERDVRPLMRERLGGLPDLRVEIYSFDPGAPDPLFDRLCAAVAQHSPERFATLTTIRSASARRIHDFVQANEARNLGDIHRLRGVGEKALALLYRFLGAGSESRESPAPGEQGMLFDKEV